MIDGEEKGPVRAQCVFPKKGGTARYSPGALLGELEEDRKVTENYIIRYERYTLGSAFYSSDVLQARITSYHCRFARI